MTVVQYQAVLRSGATQLGVTDCNVAAFVRGRFDRRWRALTVTAVSDGRQVGGIATVDGKRTWWAES